MIIIIKLSKKKTINEYIKKHKIYTCLFFIVTIGLAFVAPLKSFILQWLIDASSKESAIYYLILGSIITVLSFALEIVSRNTFSKLQCNCISTTRNNIIEQLLKREKDVEKEESNTQYLSMLTNDLQIISNDYYSSIYSIISYGGMLIFALFMYIYIDISMLLFVIIAGVTPLILPRLLDKTMERTRTNYSEKIAKYTSNIKELLYGFEVIRNFSVEKNYETLHARESKKTAQSEYRFKKYVNLSITTSSLLGNLLFFMVLLFGMFLVFDGKITIGYMVAATNLSNFVITPCQIISSSYATYKSSKKIAEKIESAMNQINDNKKEIKNINEIEEIAIDKLSFRYRKDLSLTLNNICLTWNETNKKIALIGESGSGKSTLAKLIYKYSDHFNGSIKINNKNIQEISKESLYKMIGYISQDTYIFNDSIKNNICLYNDFSEEELEDAINRAGLGKYIHSLPEGINTILSENGKNLSGGQIQRITLARTLIRKYPAIIADEVTSNLDANTTEVIMDNLLENNCMLLVITHDVYNKFMKKFDQIYTINHGQIQETNYMDN